MIVAIEGIDGAGKNTLVNALMSTLDAEIIQFPRYEHSIHAALAQKALYGHMGDLTDSIYGMATLFALDRAEIKEHLNTFATDPNKVLLLDRYVASNAAYSAARANDDKLTEWVADLEFTQLGLPAPTLQILLNTPPELAAQRAATRESEQTHRVRDRYEADGGLQRRTADAYLKLAEKNWRSPWIIANPDEHATDIAEKIAHFLNTCTRA
ncbi:dTMP kinase [Corynebacterium felinum]|uniref:Thymidylate kinase n=1 Tax=Corynebacterium felinum TaxID=131318 RepID=A0ABU2BAA4_9CORY|nr:dTMP kinase [Corynebacterium felinum]MDF5821052.1 dTMP kinase [Corynebacterium felinum]MDR7354914.1 dTMP kinase [Corynebacterium felinum]WJY94274.1 Thymidylate kinase [Corynebacterium felinum]